MVERTTASFDEFIGRVEDITVVDDQQREDGEQYHIEMKPLSVEIEGKTGLMHEWLRISAKATEKSVPSGSALDRYLKEVESLIPKAKECKEVEEALNLMKGKVFQFKKKELGQPYMKHEAKAYWTPVRLFTDEEAKKVKVAAK